MYLYKEELTKARLSLSSASLYEAEEGNKGE